MEDAHGELIEDDQGDPFVEYAQGATSQISKQKTTHLIQWLGWGFTTKDKSMYSSANEHRQGPEQLFYSDAQRYLKTEGNMQVWASATLQTPIE